MPVLGTSQALATNSNIATATGLTAANRVNLVAVFSYTSGSTPTLKASVQTSLDQGATWLTIATFAFTTSNATKYLAVDAAAGISSAVSVSTNDLSDDTAINGLLGDRIRMSITTTGTYTDASIAIHYYAV
jgi:hypothetical protein